VIFRRSRRTREARQFRRSPPFGSDGVKSLLEANPMKKDVSAVVWQEGEWFVAQCLDVDVASQGHTESEALDNLRDALQLYFTPPVATVLPQVQKIELEVAA
jgi:predicted RNase H-like HicB family nuclease